MDLPAERFRIFLHQADMRLDFVFAPTVEGANFRFKQPRDRLADIIPPLIGQHDFFGPPRVWFEVQNAVRFQPANGGIDRLPADAGILVDVAEQTAFALILNGIQDD